MCEQYFDKDRMLQAGNLFRIIDKDSDGIITEGELAD